MEETCKPENCIIHSYLGGKPEQCPNFQETWWEPEKGQPVLLKDCAPRRTMLMIQELYNRQIGLQKAQEQQRNESTKLLGAMNVIVKTISNRIQAAGKEKAIDPDFQIEGHAPKSL